MSIVRVEKTKDYTIMCNCHFREKKMSLKAKGLHSLMLSLPDDWDYSIEGLTKLSKDGRDGVAAALKELEKFGYLERKVNKNDKGQFEGYEYIVYEKPNTENQLSENLISENPTQYNTKESNTKELNTNSMKVSKRDSDGKSYESILNSLNDEDLKNVILEFIKMRKMIKKPLTNYALEQVIKNMFQLGKGNKQEMIAIVNQSIENSWQGLFPIKNNFNEKGGLPF